MIAAVFVIFMLWLSWHMAHGADITKGEFWRGRLHALVGNPFKSLLVVFTICLSLVVYLSIRTAVGEEPTPIVPALSAVFLLAGGYGIWRSVWNSRHH
jgi:hypothetical protein